MSGYSVVFICSRVKWCERGKRGERGERGLELHCVYILWTFTKVEMVKKLSLNNIY